MSLHQRKTVRFILRSLCVGATLGAASAIAHPHNSNDNAAHSHDNEASHDAQAVDGNWVHENGIGADPDNDSNPATVTGVISITGDAANTPEELPYSVITFEPPPGKHGEIIRDGYEKDFGVKFGPGLTRQICEGQRRYQYNSMCTYAAAPSGKFSAGYLHYLNSALTIEFARPVCVVTMAIYPTGGKEGEPFEFTIQGWTDTDKKLPDATAEFKWTKNTVRWRHMAGAYFLNEPASKISISMKSKDGSEAKKVLRYLIDDLAFVENDCDNVLEDLAIKAGDTLEDDDNLLTNAEDPESEESKATDEISETEQQPVTP